MAKKYFMQFHSGTGTSSHRRKRFATVEDSAGPQVIGTNNGIIEIGANVQMHRELEIIETVKFLIDATRDHNDLEAVKNGAATGSYYTAIAFGSRKDSDRRVYQDAPTGITDDDISIGVGNAAIRGMPQLEIENGWNELIEVLKENKPESVT